jgi:hypothetical protein
MRDYVPTLQLMYELDSLNVKDAAKVLNVKIEKRDF